MKYDKVTIATGGTANKISIPGSDGKGVYYLRSQDDMLKI
jgi:NAD(P)H-nitrite reductase large subunit